MISNHDSSQNTLLTPWHEYFLGKYKAYSSHKKNNASTTNTLRWHYLISLAENDKPEWLSKNSFNRLIEWLARFDVYTDLEDPFEKLSAWKKKNKLRQQGQKLVNALNILKELSNKKFLPHQKQSYEDIVNITNDIIGIELTKLEITQMHMLEKAQRIKREINNIPLEKVIKKAKEKQKQVHAKIEERKSRHLERFSNIARLFQLNPNVSRYFRKRENKFHYNKYSKKANKTSSSFGFLNALNRFLANMATSAPQLMQFLAEMSTILRALPFLGTISVIIPILLDTSRVWTKNKNSRKKALTIITIVGSVGVILTAIFAPFALGMMTVGLMIIGTGAKDVYPWIKQLLEIRSKKKELKLLQEKIQSNDFSIGNLEKQYLMIQVEENWIKNTIDKKNLDNLKKIILTPHLSLEKLENSDLLKLLHIEDINNFLIKSKEKHQNDLTKEIILLNKNKNANALNIVSGIISIVGATLLCFPTPITIAVGVSLLALSAFMGLITAFDVGTKLKKFYHNHFGATAPESHLLNDIKHKLQPVYDSTQKINQRLKQAICSKRTHASNNSYPSLQDETIAPIPPISENTAEIASLMPTESRKSNRRISLSL